MAGDLDGGSEEVRVGSAGCSPVDHGAQDPRRFVVGRSRLVADQEAEVEAWHERAGDHADERHRHGQHEAEQAEHQRRGDRDRQVRLRTHVEASLRQLATRHLDALRAPRGEALAEPGFLGLRGRQERHEPREHGDPGCHAADED